MESWGMEGSIWVSNHEYDNWDTRPQATPKMKAQANFNYSEKLQILFAQLVFLDFATNMALVWLQEQFSNLVS